MNTEIPDVTTENQAELDVDNLLLNAVLEEFPAWMLDQAGRDDHWEPAVMVFGLADCGRGQRIGAN